MFGNSLQKYMILIPAVLIALMFHELAHGLVAYWLGDDTAKRAGRLTLNPLDHLDPLGTLCMIFFGFGWAKPVPVNTSRFRHRKVGMALTALAGPLANFLLSFVLIFAVLSGSHKPDSAGPQPVFHSDRTAQRLPGRIQSDPHSAAGRLPGASGAAAQPDLL